MDFRLQDVQSADGLVRGWHRSAPINDRGVWQSGRNDWDRLGVRTRHLPTARALSLTHTHLLHVERRG